MWNFEENAVVEDESKIPEKYRGLYVQADDGDNAGKWVVADFAQGIVKDYSGTVKTLNTVRQDKKKASDESAQRRLSLKAFEELAEELGIESDDNTPLTEALRERVSQLVDDSKNGKELKVNMDKLKRQYEDKMSEAVKSKDEELNRMNSTLEKHLVGDVATREITSNKGSVELLMPVIKSSCKVVKDENGKYSVRVLDKDGDFRSDGSGDWMSVGDYVKELKGSDKYARAFDSEDKGGGGQNPGSGTRNSKVNSNGKSEELNSTQKIAVGLSKKQHVRGD